MSNNKQHGELELSGKGMWHRGTTKFINDVHKRRRKKKIADASRKKNRKKKSKR